jgi:hypothetical protein
MAQAAVKLQGLAELKAKLGKIPGYVKQEADGMMAIVANDFVNRASADAPQDERMLANQITAKKNSEMNHEVVSPAPYSAYMEFGTKSRFKAIPGIDSSKFIGKGRGDYYDFLNNILNWVKRKGIASRYSVKTRKALKHTKSDDERLVQMAEAIALSIIRHGVHPHPFFFKQLPLAQEQLNRLMKEVIAKALKAK